jgi:hypothetical protein
MKCNETQSKWCKNKHGPSKIMDTLEMYQRPRFRDVGGVISDASVFFSLPHGIPSPPMAEPLREDMAGLSSEERLEAEGEMGVRPQPRALSAFKEER